LEKNLITTFYFTTITEIKYWFHFIIVTTEKETKISHFIPETYNTIFINDNSFLRLYSKILLCGTSIWQ
jgi:hypothetical protein